MEKIRIVLIIVYVSSFCLSCNNKRHQGNRERTQIPQEFMVVTKIVDGDTFWADDGTRKGVKIRLIGVDAPESRKTFKKEVGYYGKEAKEYLKEMFSGKRVKFICDVDTFDQYGRTLAYVYLEDGTFVNADLVKNGYAMVMTIPPNVRFSEEFVKLQQEARNYNRGLWKVTE